MNQEDSREKRPSSELASKEDLIASANHTNGRIDELKTHMVEMVDKVGTLIGAQIRAEERDSQSSKTIIRLENEIIIQRKEQKDYIKNNDNRSAVMEKQILLLEREDETETKAKDKAEENKNTRKNGIIIALSVVAILAILQAIVPMIGK